MCRIPCPHVVGNAKLGNITVVYFLPPDDVTRVVLQGNEDYINANYVDVSDSLVFKAHLI